MTVVLDSRPSIGLLLEFGGVAVGEVCQGEA